MDSTGAKEHWIGEEALCRSRSNFVYCGRIRERPAGAFSIGSSIRCGLAALRISRSSWNRKRSLRDFVEAVPDRRTESAENGCDRLKQRIESEDTAPSTSPSHARRCSQRSGAHGVASQKEQPSGSHRPGPLFLTPLLRACCNVSQVTSRFELCRSR